MGAKTTVTQDPEEDNTEQPTTPPVGDPEEDPEEGKAAPVDFDGWFKALPKEHKALVDAHIAGLKTALRSERGSNAALEVKLKELAKLTEKGSELEGQLKQLSTDLSVEAAKAEFFDAAHGQKVTNLRLAWLAARDADLVDVSSGACDFDKLREVAPELFVRATTPTGNAGSGTTQGGVKMQDMNALLRQAAGRG